MVCEFDAAVYALVFEVDGVSAFVVCCGYAGDESVGAVWMSVKVRPR